MILQVPKLIFNAMYAHLQDSTFDYMKTRQRGWCAREEELFAAHMYPWGFIERVGYGRVEHIRAPEVFEYTATFAVVALTFADLADMESVIVNTEEAGTNVNKGVLDIEMDVGAVFWPRKRDNFGITGVQEVHISGAADPSIPKIAPLLAHPYIRGTQIDFEFTIWETGVN